ncbi:MAG: formylglycine-generating enzyme family protein [Kiritimatiellia bacterium]
MNVPRITAYFKRASRFVVGCMLLACFSIGTQAQGLPAVEIRLAGANPGAMPLTAADPQPQALFLGDPLLQPQQGAHTASAAGAFRHVYPGIHLAHFYDEHHIEFAFVLSQGADPSLIRFLIDGAERKELTPEGHIIYLAEGFEIYQQAPVMREQGQNGNALQASAAKYTLQGTNETRLASTTINQSLYHSLNDTHFNAVPADVGLDGPDYDYFMARYEVTNRQWVRFLNDSQQNPNNARGENLFFDERGNVWFHPDMQANRDEIFAIDPERIQYVPDRMLGDRYRLQSNPDGTTQYAEHPVTGVSWYGALKYCNWLTLVSGRGLAQRAYREGTNSVAWAPVTATNWANGEFSFREREAWTSVEGFRLPMFNVLDDATRYPTNAFNEFSKAAAWNGETNTIYGFGRDTFSTNDAVVLNTVLRQGVGLLPVGYFDGQNRLPAGRTIASENGFGIHDLTGNVNEWLNDFPRRGVTDARLTAGGSFEDPLRTVYETRMLAPHAAGATGGFRPITTDMPESVTLIHVLFCFHSTNDIPTALREKYRVPEAGVSIDALFDAPGLIPDLDPSGPAIDDLVLTPDAHDPIDPLSEEDLPDLPGVLVPDDDQVVVPPFFPPGTGGPGTSPDPDIPGPPRPPSALLELLVQSQNPNSGVVISVSRDDHFGYADGTTTFARFYTPGTQVTLTAPPSAGNGVFLHWLRNGIPFALSTSVTVEMLSDVTFTAVYVSPQPPPQRTLTINSTPVLGVPISVSVRDNDGLQDGSTTFSRTYDQGQQVTVTAPPSANGEPFLGWLRNGQPFSNDRTVTVTLFNNTTLTAQYGQAVQTEERRLSINSANPDSDVPITISIADNNGQQDGATSLNRLYDFGTEVLVTAPLIASNGNTFSGWYLNGVLISTDPQLPVSMITDLILTAIYIPPPPDVVLTVGSDGPNSGVSMVVTTPDNNGQTDGLTLFTRTYTEGASTTVTAPLTAPNGNVFRRWLLNGSPITTNRNVSVTLLADAELIAVYRPPEPPPRIFDLQVNASNPDTGINIAVSVADINNAGDGVTSFTRSYLENTAVNLTAPSVAPNGHLFVRWLVDGVPVSDQNTISLIMNNHRSVTAEYEPPPPIIRYTLDVETRNPNSLVFVTTTPSDVNGSPTSQTAPYNRLFDAGTLVTITARNPAFPGSAIFLQQWLLDGVPYSTNATIQVAMLADHTVTAIYGPPLPPDNRVLTVASSNPDADVPITVSVSDVNGDASGNTIFDRLYPHGENVTLTAPATAPNGNPFLHWLYDGILLSADQSITVSMIADVTVTAVYADLPPVINLAVRSRNPSTGVLVSLDVEDLNGDQNGVTAFNRQYHEGQTVTLTTTPLAPNGRDIFVRWERDGVPVSTNTTTTITLYQDTQMTAVYEPPPTLNLTVRSRNPDLNVSIAISEPDTQNRTDGNTTFVRTYNPGTLTTITAPETAPNEAPFVRWLLNGQPYSLDPSITLEMLTDYEITAVFGDPPPPRRILVVRSVNPDSDVPIEVSFPDERANEDGLSPFLRLYDDGTLLTLVAPPTAGTNAFRQWILNGVPISTNLTTDLLMSQDHELIAVYGPPAQPAERVLTVDSRNPFSGVPIEVSQADISGDTDGTTVFVRIYNYGEFTTLVAPELAATNNYAFLYWERDGEQFSTDRSVTIEMVTDIRMTAVYGPFVPDVTLTVESQNPDSGVSIVVSPADLDSLTTGTTTFNRTYEMGQNVLLNAPEEVDGQPFLRWLFNGTPLSTNNIVNVTLLSDVTMTAVYGDPVPVENVVLTIASEGPDGPIGTLLEAVSPDISGNTTGTTIIQRIYTYGDTVTITTPATSNGFNFSHWSVGGAVFSSNRTVDLLMLADTTITAIYVEPPPSVGGL